MNPRQLIEPGNIFDNAAAVATRPAAAQLFRHKLLLNLLITR